MAVKEKKTTLIPSDGQTTDFQKKLLRFYRTGVNPSGYPDASLRSIFQTHFAEMEHPYPFSLDEELLEHDDELLDKLIVYQLSQYQKKLLGNFKKQLNQLISGLSKILNVSEAAKEDHATYDFAAQMIAFDRLAEVVPDGKEKLSDQRRNRLTKVLKRLKRGLKSFSKLDAVLVRTMGSYATVGSSEHMQVITASRKQAFAEVKDMLSHNMKAFTRLMKAYHKAVLEVDGTYEEAIHDDYFRNFSWYWLSEEEKQLMQPVFLMLDESYAVHHQEQLSELLTTNWPVKILVLNNHLVSKPMEAVAWEDATHRVRPELATYAISHRSVNVYQLTSADPKELCETLGKWIGNTGPTLIHLLMPENGNVDEAIATRAASSARYFPKVTYEPKTQKRWDISENPQAKKSCPLITLDDETPDGKDLLFTYADYKSLISGKVQELMLIPENYVHPDLRPLAEYMQLAGPAKAGKVPYILLMDAEDGIHRAAVPYNWIVSCEERLEFWRFLQGLCGASTELQKEVPSDIPATAPNPDREVLDLAAKEELEQQAMIQAAERLVRGLLEGDG